MIFWDRKSQNRFKKKKIITKLSDLVSNLNDDGSQLSFEVYNICVAQKLRILEFLINFFRLEPGHSSGLPRPQFQPQQPQ